MPRLSSSQFALWLASAALAAFAGSALTSHLPAVRAQVVVPQTPITARSFVLVDNQGRKRGELSTLPDGRPFLKFYDTQGNVVWNAAGGARLLPLDVDR
jgi:hypothetical protein